MLTYGIDWQNPISNHPLNNGLVEWYLAGVPGRSWGGGIWRGLKNRYPGTLTNMDPATDWVPGGRPGGWGALDFDGSNDYVTFDSSLIGSTGTLMMWATPAFNAADDAVIAQLFGFGNDVDFNGLELRYEFRNSGGANDAWAVICNSSSAYMLYANNQSFSAGDDIHLAFAWDFDSDAYALYVDGNLAASSSEAKTLPSLANAKFGAGVTTGTYNYSGSIDDIRIFDRVLSANDVSAIHRLSGSRNDGLLNRIPMPSYATAAAPAVGNPKGVFGLPLQGCFAGPFG